MDVSHHEPSPRPLLPALIARGMRHYPLRLALYAVIAAVVCQIVFELVSARGIEFAGRENGPVELAQVVLAFSAAAALGFAGCRLPRRGGVLVVCGCLVAYAAARESDQWFETVFFDDAYKYLAGGPLALLAAVTLIRTRRTLIEDWTEMLPTPALTLFAVAGIYLCSLCQLLDRPDLWTAAGGPQAEMTKAAVEEFAELFGYLLLAFAGTESLTLPVTARRIAKRQRSTQTVVAADAAETAASRAA